VATQKRVVKNREQKYFRTPRKILENPKRLFQNFGDFWKIFQKKVPVKNTIWMVWLALQNSSQFIRDVYCLPNDFS
jgi:hypothetical protein